MVLNIKTVFPEMVLGSYEPSGSLLPELIPVSVA